MSYNRRMFGGRPGGGGGGPGGPMGPVSPWEGGVVPGQGRAPSAGILGAAPQHMNLLSQLTTPEAQLALASNLLTSLLGQQQQQPAPMQQPRIPPGPQPLLSMNTGPGRGFFRPDGMKQGLGPMRQQRGHGSRFPDNYKQRGDRPRGNVMNKRGGGSGAMQRSPRKSAGVSTAKKDSEKKIEANSTEKVKVDIRSELKEEMDPEVKDEEEDEEGEEGKKRDWKDEKNKKDESMDTQEEEEDEEDKEPGTKSGKNSIKDTSGKGISNSESGRYADIPKELLVCHICSKNMWDGQSFENHLRGKSHQMMMDQTEKAYKVRVKLMRHELKLAEEKREIEMERVQRLGKKVNNKNREYCTMCDLYFFGNIMGHRKNQLHQNLKNFLHPRCKVCAQEFPSRTEWDHHQLTPLHLQKLTESNKYGKDGAMVVEDEPASTDSEEKVLENTDAASGEEKSAEGVESPSEAREIGGEATEDAKTPSEEAEAAAPGTPAAKKVPAARVVLQPYDPRKSYGTNLLKKVVGFTCDVCNRFFFQHKEALAHCQTAPHYKSYAAYMLRTGAALPPNRQGKREDKQAPTDKTSAAATPTAPASAPSPVEKAGEKPEVADEAPDCKRPRKEEEAKTAEGGEGEAVATDQKKDQSATVDSEDNTGAKAGDVVPGPAAVDEPANGDEAIDSEDIIDEAADEGDDDSKCDGIVDNKNAAGVDEASMDADDDLLPKEDKKLGGGGGGAGGGGSSPSNRRGAGRGAGRGRGRAHRRSNNLSRQSFQRDILVDLEMDSE